MRRQHTRDDALGRGRNGHTWRRCNTIQWERYGGGNIDEPRWRPGWLQEWADSLPEDSRLWLRRVRDGRTYVTDDLSLVHAPTEKGWRRDHKLCWSDEDAPVPVFVNLMLNRQGKVFRNWGCSQEELRRRRERKADQRERAKSAKRDPRRVQADFCVWTALRRD